MAWLVPIAMEYRGLLGYLLGYLMGYNGDVMGKSIPNLVNVYSLRTGKSTHFIAG